MASKNEHTRISVIAGIFVGIARNDADIFLCSSAVRMMRWWADEFDRLREHGRVIKMRA